jgi:hypothetical protein
VADLARRFVVRLQQSGQARLAVDHRDVAGDEPDPRDHGLVV